MKLYDIHFWHKGRWAYAGQSQGSSAASAKKNFLASPHNAVYRGTKIRAVRSKMSNPSATLPRNKWVTAQIRVTSSGKVQAKLPASALRNPAQNPSQYTSAYLRENDSRIAQGLRPITPGTFLAYNLRGVAKSYSSGYKKALERDLRDRGAQQVKSAGGGTAFISRSENPRRRNIAAGFYDEDGYFHPIRASYDYSRKRAGEQKKTKKRK